MKGIAELITLPGLINVDFADVKTIMQNSGNAIMGMGLGSGEKRAITAIRQAISSPLLDTTIDGAKGILLNIVGGEDLSMSEIDEAATMIAKSVDPDANIIFGAAIDEKLVDQIKITVIATRFDENRMKLFKFQRPSTPNEERVEESENLKEENIELYPPEETDKTKDDKPDKPTSVSADNDEFDIPAFLRRK